MSEIHRISLLVADYHEIEVGGPILSVAADRKGRSDVLDLWFENGDYPSRKVAVYMVGTGHPLPWSSRPTKHAYRFVGSVVTALGLVWHVYTSDYLRDQPIPEIRL